MRGRLPVVCQLLHGLEVGGAEMLAVRLARRLAGAYRFVFLCLDRLGALSSGLRRAGQPVYLAGRRPGVDWRCAWQAADVLRRERVDLIHAHQYTPFFYGLSARLLQRRPPILFTEHGRASPDGPRPRRMLVNRLFLERRDRVAAVGQAVRLALIENEGIPSERIEVVYNGVGLGEFLPDRGARHSVRRELNAGTGDYVLLQAARFDAVKDHATALRAVRLAAARSPQLRLLLVGDGPERPRIEEQVRAEGLGHLVRFLGTRLDVSRLLWAADAVLLTSRSEGIPLTLLEGMSACLPVVGTRVGGVPEVVIENETGLLAPVGDAPALARLIEWLATHPDRGREMGGRGRERVVRYFSEERMAQRYAQLYEEMLGG